MSKSKIIVEKKKIDKKKIKPEGPSQAAILQSARETERKIKDRKDNDTDVEVFTEWE